MNPAQSRSKTRVALIVVGVVAAITILGGAGYAVYTAMTTKTDKNQQQTATKTTEKADFSSLEPGLASLQEKMKKVATDHQKAQDAVNDASKRVTLSK